MSASARIVVDLDVLGAHRRAVAAAEDEVALAGDAAASVNLGAGAFGTLCAFLVGPLGFVQGSSGAALAAAGDALGRADRELGHWVREAAETELGAVDVLMGLLDEVGGAGGSRIDRRAIR